MNNRRMIVLLVFALALLVGAHFALDVNFGRDPALIRPSALVDFAADALTVEIERADAGALRMEKDGEWRIVTPYAAVADGERVRRLMDALAFSEIVDCRSNFELLRDGGRTGEDFELLTPRLKVTVGDGTRLRTVSFGSLTPSLDACYAAVDGFSAVLVVGTNVLAAVDMPFASFRDRRLGVPAADEIESFAVHGGVDKLAVFSRKAAGWEMTEPRSVQVKASAVRRLLTGLGEARAVDFVWPVGASNETAAAGTALLASYGLDAESAVSVTLRGGDAAEHVIAFGRDALGECVYAMADGGSAIVTVDARLKSDFFEASRVLSDGRLFAEELSTVTSISLTDDETVYLLARDSEGGWRLESPVAAAADQSVADDLAGRVLSLRWTNLDSHGVTVAAGTNSGPFTVSRQAVLGGLWPEELRSKAVLKLPAAKVKRIVLTRRGSAVSPAVVFDPERRVWNVEVSEAAGEVDQTAIQELLAALEPLKALRVVKLKILPSELSDYGLDDPEFIVAVDRADEDSVRRNILIGESTEGGRYATVGSSDAVFVLDAATVRTLTRELVTRD